MVTISNLYIYDYPNNVAGDPTPVFAWDESSSATLYELQISYATNDFSSPIYDIQFSPQPTPQQYLLTPEASLVYEGPYFAQLRAYDGTSWGNYSDTLSFIVSLFPPIPPRISPVTSPAKGLNQLISGTKAINLYVYISNNNGPFVEVNYPGGVSSVDWNYNLSLSAGDNNIAVCSSVVHSIGGALSIKTTAYVYLASLRPQVYNVWNAFDELGLLLGLQRNMAEKNISYKSRLEDVYVNPGNSTYKGVINGVARELNIPKTEVTVNNLSDLMDPNFSGNLLNEDGNAIGTPLIDYAEEVYEHNPVFLGTIISDESYWDGVSLNTNGYTFLPHIWDASASGIPNNWQGGGIGDHDDLWVTGPLLVWNSGILDYNWYLQIHTGYFYSQDPWGFFGAPSGVFQLNPSGFFVEDDQGIFVLDPSGVRIMDDSGTLF